MEHQKALHIAACILILSKTASPNKDFLSLELTICNTKEYGVYLPPVGKKVKPMKINVNLKQVWAARSQECILQTETSVEQ